MTLIELEKVSKAFGGNVVVSELDLAFPDAAFTVMLGPSGCGKSTTLNMIAGLETVSAGEIRFDGTPVTGLPPHKRDIAMVFQSYALYPQMTVRQNMAFGLKVRRTPRSEIRARVSEAAAMLSIEDLLDRKPGTLSGGQRQRAAVGRAMVRRPRAFLLDEPLSNVDAKLRGEMRGELRSLQRRLGATFVYVTHDQLEAMAMADYIAIMNGGVLLQVGSPDEIYARPAWLFVAEFVGSPPMNLLDGTIEQVAGSAVAVLGPWRVPLEGAPAGACVVGVHYEDVGLAAHPGDLPGHVVNVEHLGAENRVMVETACGIVGVRVERSVRVELDAEVGVVAQPTEMHVFDRSTGARLPTVHETRGHGATLSRAPATDA
jgi:ABC-type sugar transport system ATPase subunit